MDRNPCLSCERRHKDKNCIECMECEKRLAYCASLGGMTHSMPDDLTVMRGGGFGRGGNDVANHEPMMNEEQTEFLEIFCREQSIRMDDLLHAKFHAVYRKEAARRMRDELQMDNHEIAEVFGVTESSVYHWIGGIEKMPEGNNMETKTCKVCGEERSVKKFQVSALKRKRGDADIWIDTCKRCQGEKIAESLKLKAERKEAQSKEAQSKEAQSNQQSPIANRQSKSWIIVDLEAYPELHQAICDIAKDELRTPENQALYWLRRNVRARDTGVRD